MLPPALLPALRSLGRTGHLPLNPVLRRHTKNFRRHTYIGGLFLARLYASRRNQIAEMVSLFTGRRKFAKGFIFDRSIEKINLPI